MTCELWQCSECGEERAYGGITDLKSVLHIEGAQLNCEKCKSVTKHTFTGKHQETRNAYSWKQQLVN